MLLYESHSEIESICKKYLIQNYTINDDGSVDVIGINFIVILTYLYTN